MGLISVRNFSVLVTLFAGLALTGCNAVGGAIGMNGKSGGFIQGAQQDAAAIGNFFRGETKLAWSDAEDDFFDEMGFDDKSVMVQLNSGETVGITFQEPRRSGYLTEEAKAISGEISSIERSMKNIDVTDPQYAAKARTVLAKKQQIADMEAVAAAYLRDRADERVNAINGQITELGNLATADMITERDNAAGFRTRMANLSASWYTALNSDSIGQMAVVHGGTVSETFPMAAQQTDGN